MKHIRNEKGFTLIELMVVILIIGILVAIAVPVFNSARAGAYKSTCQANLRTLDGAVQTWKASNPSSNFPTDTDSLMTTLVNGGYLKDEPRCPEGDQTDPADRYQIQAGTGGTTVPVIYCPVNAQHTY